MAKQPPSKAGTEVPETVLIPVPHAVAKAAAIARPQAAATPVKGQAKGGDDNMRIRRIGW